jgi:hypothetical protein
VLVIKRLYSSKKKKICPNVTALHINIDIHTQLNYHQITPENKHTHKAFLQEKVNYLHEEGMVLQLQ